MNAQEAKEKAAWNSLPKLLRDCIEAAVNAGLREIHFTNSYICITTYDEEWLAILGYTVSKAIVGNYTQYTVSW